MSEIRALEGVTREYAWGSPTAIPELLNRPLTGAPVAEVWFETDSPFLLKVLAADRALSIQVHPTRAQAVAGFADEQARGIPLDARHRRYSDANHKPELLWAVTDFDALCGFRPIADTVRLLEALAVAELIAVRDALTGPDGLRAAFSVVLATASTERPRLLAATLAACRRELSAGGEWLLSARASLLAARDFPGDIGAVLALLLNAVRLAPGEALYLGAGNVHAYLRGTGVEIMAASDNVLRCGLTPKLVDVAEVLRVADFSALADPRCQPRTGPAGELIYDVPVPDFQLSVWDVTGPLELTADAPQVLLCTAGAVEVHAIPADDATLWIGPDQSRSNPVATSAPVAAFVPGGVGVRVSGAGKLFRATTPPTVNG